MRTGRVLIRPDADLLTVWSGLPHPPIRAAIGPEEVAAFDDHAAQLLALPWRTGVKYFYGHDVDGGPGLHP